MFLITSWTRIDQIMSSPIPGQVARGCELLAAAESPSESSLAALGAALPPRPGRAVRRELGPRRRTTLSGSPSRRAPVASRPRAGGAICGRGGEQKFASNRKNLSSSEPWLGNVSQAIIASFFIESRLCQVSSKPRLFTVFEKLRTQTSMKVFSIIVLIVSLSLIAADGKWQVSGCLRSALIVRFSDNAEPASSQPGNHTTTSGPDATPTPPVNPKDPAARRSHVCSQEKREGSPCERPKQRLFYYDRESKTCKEFIYTGCFGNDNSFATIEECQELCADFWFFYAYSV